MRLLSLNHYSICNMLSTHFKYLTIDPSIVFRLQNLFEAKIFDLRRESVFIVDFVRYYGNVQSDNVQRY